MSYRATNPASFKDQSVGDGQCVAFVRTASNAPPAATWKKGISVKGASIEKGTAIATFTNGVYESNITGNHAAIYESQDPTGLWVWDQWKNHRETQPVHKRHISFRGGQGSASNDGDAFAVIE